MKIYHFKKGKSHYTNQKDDTYGIWFLCGAKADQGETIIGLGDGLICKTCQKIINGDTIQKGHQETVWTNGLEGKMKGNIYHDGNEMSVELIKFRITELEKEEKEQKDAHLPYQVLLKFFYDVRAIINE